MLRDARRVLGADIDYLTSSLPQLIEFPESKDMGTKGEISKST